MAVNINVPSQVKTYANLAAFPATGALKTIYIAEDTNKTYRWTGSVYVEVSASAASGITIGSTAIASGVVGRVLFEGAGNVVQESSSLFWDATNNRLGVGTETPTTQMQIVGSSNASILTLTSGTRNADIAVYGSGSLFEIGTQASYPLSFKTNSTGRMIIYGGGNVGIGTTTDAGFKLDVNGTARVSGLLSLTDNNGIQFTTGFGNNAGNMISSQGSSTLLVMNRGSRVLKFWNGGSPANQSIQIGYGIDALAPSNLASAIVQIDSTTKGFLPPRMTTTEKNAIASPATGLQVFDTTLNQMSYYNGTTWTNI